MKNWIDFAAEVREAANPAIKYLHFNIQFCRLDSGGFMFQFYKQGTVNCANITFYGDDLTGERVSVEFRDNYTNPTDFDALLDEANAWWNEFKTSDHPILLDNQIRKTLRHEQ